MNVFRTNRKVDAPLRALIFDSVYNPFRGVETYFRVINGSIKKGQKIKFVATDKNYYADEVGTFKAKAISAERDQNRRCRLPHHRD